MNGKEGEPQARTTDITPVPTDATPNVEMVNAEPKKKKSAVGSLLNFVYNSKRKTVLGRDAMNWFKLALFYMIFFFCVSCFFTGLLYLFTLTLNSRIPKYYNEDSTMTVRTSASIVGLGFRPQPNVRENRIIISDDPTQQNEMVSSLRLFRDVYLRQKPDARVERCTRDEPANELPQGVACEFDWSDIVRSKSHPCSEENLFGFKQKQPCILVKINKVYGWEPQPVSTFSSHHGHHGINSTNVHPKTSDVHVTCQGSQADDRAVLHDITYYSLEHPLGSKDYGAVPHYYFPYRNAPDHVQPFILVQFKDLPANRVVDVLCKISAPGLHPERRTMRGYVSFELENVTQGKKTKRDL